MSEFDLLVDAAATASVKAEECKRAMELAREASYEADALSSHASKALWDHCSKLKAVRILSLSNNKGEK